MRTKIEAKMSGATVETRTRHQTGCSNSQSVSLICVFVVVGNLIPIVLFTVNKRLRKRSLFLIISMAFADLMLGALSMPGYIFFVGAEIFQLWTGSMPKSLDYANDVIDTVFKHASLILSAMTSGERLYTRRISEHYQCEHTVLLF